MNIKQIIINYFTDTDVQYITPVLVKIVLVVGILWVVNRYWPRWKYVTWCILLVVLARVALFDQPISWGFYNNRLTVDDIGWRQQSLLPVEYYKFLKYPQKTKFLAVGSSQTYTIYNDYSHKNAGPNIFNLAGMSPLDFYLYRKYIADRNSEYILLYLSEFDLAKEPDLNASKGAPNQGSGFLKILPVLHELSKETHGELALKEIVVGEFFPEYKYSFVFKGFLDQVMKKNEAFHAESLYAHLTPDRDELKKSIKDISEELDARWIKYNDYFLKEFLYYCRERSLKVIIVEGQYNPLAYTDKNKMLYQMSHKVLEDIAQKFGFVTFLPRTNVMPLVSDDYRDVVHVKPEAGYRFVQDLLAKLESMGIK